MRFLLPTGIGDSVWALHKVQAIAASLGEARIDIGLTCGVASSLESRALDFVRRFSFVDSVRMCPGYAILRDPAFTPDGYWNYIDDGIYEFEKEKWCVLVPNAALERGLRLESWLPHIPINWNIFDDFHIAPAERDWANDIFHRLSPYVVFYPGPHDGNTVQGHNRNMIWRPQDWLDLGRQLHTRYGLHIVVVGAPYDAPYYDTLLSPQLNGDAPYWHNFIGQTNIGQLYALIDNSHFAISYQAGVGIVSTYLNVPTGIFWRAKGDSIVPGAMLSFEESMASAWVPPKQIANGTHLPLIYGRHGVPYILAEIEKRGWA